MISLKKEISPKIFKKVIIVGGMILLVLILGLGYFFWQAKTYQKVPEPQVLKTFIVKGNSMEPTLKDGQEVTADLIYYKSHQIEQGDIIVISKLGALEDPLVKRVIAVPGDKLEFKDGQLFINDQALKENYLKDTNYQLTEEELSMALAPLKNYGSPFVPTDMVLVLSDNRSAKLDSRTFGLLSTPLIIGKVISY